MPIKLPVHVIKMDGGFARLQGADFWISPGVLDSAEAIQIADALNDAARYRKALEEVLRIAHTLHEPWHKVVRVAKDALADAGKGGGE